MDRDVGNHSDGENGFVRQERLAPPFENPDLSCFVPPAGRSFRMRSYGMDSMKLGPSDMMSLPERWKPSRPDCLHGCARAFVMPVTFRAKNALF
jgi:hypothetical protein